MKHQSWFNTTWSIDWLRQQARNTHLPEEHYILPFLKMIGVVPRYSDFDRVFAYYPLLNRDAIKGEHLASLAVEWDREGPSDVFSWLNMVELECSGNPHKDTIIKVLEAASELSD